MANKTTFLVLRDGEPHEVICHDCQGGLMITASVPPSRPGDKWVITHAQSSQTVSAGIGKLPTLRAARIALQILLASEVDWTLHTKVLLQRKHVRKAEEAFLAAKKALEVGAGQS